MTHPLPTSSIHNVAHAIIAGFGLPGRAAANVLEAQGRPFCVIELNRATCERCNLAGLQIIEGDVAHEETLRKAGIETATLLVLAVPNERAVLEAVRIARRLNPGIHIVARCHYTSTGMAATASGADQVIVAEQVVANEITSIVSATVWDTPAPQQTP